MKNKIDDLRNHLFAALEGLSDEENPMQIERAQAIATVAQTIINSATAETEFLKVTNREPSTCFIPQESSVPLNVRLVSSSGERK
jgi:hypothetical protein